MELPQYNRPKGAFAGQDVVLKLNKTLYGQGDSPLQWFKFLSQGIFNLGFEASKSDPCLFIHKTEKIMVVGRNTVRVWMVAHLILVQSTTSNK